MFYWVLQEVGGQLVKHGPWKSEDARSKAYERISGGEVHKFNSFSDDPEVVDKEFRSEEIKKL